MRKAPYAHNSLTRAEAVFGWLYLPVYLALLPFALQIAFAFLHIEPSLLTLNTLCAIINLLAVAIGFRRFLSQRFFGGRFWNFVQACILGAAMHYVGTWLVGYACDLLHQTVPTYNNDVIESLTLSDPYVMLVTTVILAPVVEEVLFRGVVFGTLCRTSRLAAYLASALLFALTHTWQFFFSEPAWSVVLSTLPYLPAGIALAWTYDRADTVWAPITLHAIINAVSCGLVSLS